MPRASRHYIPGYVWHITHRCHKKEFLFKFSRDRERWVHWLFEAKKRFELRVLNYIVILLRDKMERETMWSESIAVGNEEYIEKTMEKLGIQGNRRKVFESHGDFLIREPQIPYKAHFDAKMGSLSVNNDYFWQ